MSVASSVLIVDDDPKVHFLIDTLFAGDGYRLLHANSGPEALAIARTSPPDVVLLDLMMPRMDGYEVCRRIRADARLASVPVLMLTAMDDRTSKLRGLEAGVDDYLTKPVDGLELRTRLRTVTRLNRFRSLYDERARFEAVVAAAPDGIVMAAPDGTIILANLPFLRMAPGAVSLNVFECLAIGPADAWRRAVAACSPGDTLPVLPETPLAGAPERVVEISGCVREWEGSPVLHLHVRDITERKALEAQLLRSQRIELLGQLAGGIVHDVNNVLTAIMGATDLLDSTPDGEQWLVETIRTSAARGAGLLRQVLIFAKGSPADTREVDVRVIVEEVGAIARDSFGRQYAVSVDVPADLPPLLADPTQLHQILMNLCVNARDAMPEGGALDLSAEVRDLTSEERATAPDARQGRHLALWVRDTGTGIPPEVRPRLFDPFFTTKPPDKGTGLGLATVLRIVRRHGGFVSVETEIGKGTCFTCLFPLRREGDVQGPEEPGAAGIGPITAS